MMTTVYRKGDHLKGKKVICESRKMSPIKIINKTGRHKAQQIILRDNVDCYIDIELNYL